MSSASSSTSGGDGDCCDVSVGVAAAVLFTAPAGAVFISFTSTSIRPIIGFVVFIRNGLIVSANGLIVSANGLIMSANGLIMSANGLIMLTN